MHLIPHHNNFYPRRTNFWCYARYERLSRTRIGHPVNYTVIYAQGLISKAPTTYTANDKPHARKLSRKIGPGNESGRTDFSRPN